MDLVVIGTSILGAVGSYYMVLLRDKSVAFLCDTQNFKSIADLRESLKSTNTEGSTIPICSFSGYVSDTGNGFIIDTQQSLPTVKLITTDKTISHPTQYYVAYSRTIYDLITRFSFTTGWWRNENRVTEVSSGSVHCQISDSDATGPCVILPRRVQYPLQCVSTTRMINPFADESFVRTCINFLFGRVKYGQMAIVNALPVWSYLTIVARVSLDENGQIHAHVPFTGKLIVSLQTLESLKADALSSQKFWIVSTCICVAVCLVTIRWFEEKRSWSTAFRNLKGSICSYIPSILNE